VIRRILEKRTAETVVLLLAGASLQVIGGADELDEVAVGVFDPKLVAQVHGAPVGLGLAPGQVRLQRFAAVRRAHPKDLERRVVRGPKVDPPHFDLGDGVEESWQRVGGAHEPLVVVRHVRQLGAHLFFWCCLVGGVVCKETRLSSNGASEG